MCVCVCVYMYMCIYIYIYICMWTGPTFLFPCFVILCWEVGVLCHSVAWKSDSPPYQGLLSFARWVLQLAFIWKVFVLSYVWSLNFLLHYICGQPWPHRGFLKCLDPKYRAKQSSTCLNFSVVPARDVSVVWGSQNKGKHLRWSFREWLE